MKNQKLNMKNAVIKYFVITIVVLTFSKTNAQSCGFGCLGLSGIFGGYSVQKYEADGLNTHLNILVNPPWSSFVHNDSYNFNEGKGFKVGINLVRAQYSKFFFTFKGYYQFLSEEQSIKIPNGPDYYTFYDAKFEMNNWGIGLDLGIPLLSFVDWKIIDGELKFFSPKLTYKNYSNNPLANYISLESTYTPDKVKMGYSVGSGLIFNIIQDYISIEATGMFTFIEIDNLTDDQDRSSVPSQDLNTKLILNGGFQGAVQLNVGIPF
ncbi:MAG: hypothetical protein KKF62_09170 [Bacteroidetes bacterium]|nr:hypothetical protein [Bacteroidota bacterium]MBU1116536.1 hypothetical protein [Bacteroidota bacterium]MBU1796844.1 hypothetical protein [Bacteroidota bacterium]